MSKFEKKTHSKFSDITFQIFGPNQVKNSMVAIATKELKIYIQISLKFLPSPGTPCRKNCI